MTIFGNKTVANVPCQSPIFCRNSTKMEDFLSFFAAFWRDLEAPVWVFAYLFEGKIFQFLVQKRRKLDQIFLIFDFCCILAWRCNSFCCVRPWKCNRIFLGFTLLLLHCVLPKALFNFVLPYKILCKNGRVSTIFLIFLCLERCCILLEKIHFFRFFWHFCHFLPIFDFFWNFCNFCIFFGIFLYFSCIFLNFVKFWIFLFFFENFNFFF